MSIYLVVSLVHRWVPLYCCCLLAALHGFNIYIAVIVIILLFFPLGSSFIDSNALFVDSWCACPNARRPNKQQSKYFAYFALSMGGAAPLCPTPANTHSISILLSLCRHRVCSSFLAAQSMYVFMLLPR